MRVQRSLQWCFAGCVMGLFGLAIARQVFYLPDAGLIAQIFWVTLLALIPMQICAAAHDRARAPRWMLSGIITGILTILMVLLGSLTGALEQATMLLAMVIPGVWTVGVALIGLLLNAGGRGTAVTWLRGAGGLVGVGAALLFASLIVAGVLDLARSLTLERWSGFGGAIMIVYFCLLCALWLVARSRMWVEGEDEAIGAYRFAATCPRCEQRQIFATGRDACSGCGLIIRVVPT